MTKTIRIRLMTLLLAGVAASTAYGEPQKSSGEYIIKTGVGIEECPIKLCDEKRFNELFQSTRTGSYLLAHQQGVEALLRRGKVRTLFFYFNSETKNSFNGKTETGIDKSSARDDVIRQYGETKDILSGPVFMASGEKAQEETLGYNEKGISFTFVNDKLADIRVYSPPISQPDISIQEKRAKLVGEWLENWADSEILPFKEAFLIGQVGAVLGLEAGGKAVLFIPCNVNEKITKDLKLTGTWSLNDRGEFETQFKEKNAAIGGMLTIDEESEDIDQLIVKQGDNTSRRFGRLDRSQVICD